MICLQCKNPHIGKPDDCWNIGCCCQHEKAEVYLPTPKENKVVGWTCPGCDIVTPELENECQCPGAEITVKLPVHEDERA